MKGAVPKHRMREQVGGGHGHHNPGIVHGLAEVPHDAIPFGSRGIDGHQIVVVEVDAPGTNLGQHVDDFDRCHHPADRIAERIAADVAHSPQTKSELVLRPGNVLVAHVGLYVSFNKPARPKPGRPG